MRNEIRISKKYERIAKELINEIPELHPIRDCGVRIAYVTSTEQKKKSCNRVVHADCNKVDELYKTWCKYDFIIRVYEDNITGMSKNQIRILLWHELLHVGIDDKTLEPKYIVVPHDIEDFEEIVKRFGINWSEVGRRVPKIKDVITDEQ